jgi:hypothetical protein
MTSRFLKITLVLGLLSTIGLFAIDMYLPALPAIGIGLSADIGWVTDRKFNHLAASMTTLERLTHPEFPLARPASLG